jgi:hypothetical protein
VDIAHGNAQDLEPRAKPLSEKAAIGQEILVNPSANRTKAC